MKMCRSCRAGVVRCDGKSSELHRLLCVKIKKSTCSHSRRLITRDDLLREGYNTSLFINF